MSQYKFNPVLGFMEMYNNDLPPAIQTTGWKDNINVFFMNAKGKGYDEPTWEDMGNGLFAMRFDVGNELFFMFHVNHDYKIGTQSFPHIHWCSNAIINIGESLVWHLNFTVARGYNQGDSLIKPTTEIDITFTADQTIQPGVHQIAEASVADSVDLIEPDVLMLGRARLTSKTMAGDVYGFLVDLHYQSNRDHTPNKNFPFYGGS